MSLRAGNTRRQVHLDALDRPLKFPTGVDECATLKVEVLNVMASGRLAFAPDQTDYILTLDDCNGDVSNMEVIFRVLPLESGGADADEKEAQKTKDVQKEASARAYLEKHGLTNFMQLLMQSLMKDKPSDPYVYLQRQVTKRMIDEVARGTSLSLQGDTTFLPEEMQRTFDHGFDTMLVQIADSKEVENEISREHLERLAEEAHAAGVQLREDNMRLREVTMKLKQSYGELLQDCCVPGGSETSSTLDDGRPSGSAQVLALQQIIRFQDEVGSIAKENKALVELMAGMRARIATISSDLQEQTAT